MYIYIFIQLQLYHFAIFLSILHYAFLVLLPSLHNHHFNRLHTIIFEGGTIIPYIILL